MRMKDCRILNRAMLCGGQKIEDKEENIGKLIVDCDAEKLND